METRTYVCYDKVLIASEILNFKLMFTCRSVEVLGIHFSPDQVPSRDRQTLPHAYRLGLNLTLPPAVVLKVTRGGTEG